MKNTPNMLPTNCFTIGRFGTPVEGIRLSLSQGKDKYRPLTPHILVAGYSVHVDYDGGCLYEKVDAETGLVRQAELRVCGTDKVFYTLKQPMSEKMGYSLIKINCHYTAGAVVVNDRELRLYSGVYGGTAVAGQKYEVLVKLAAGEQITIFYEDGGVRQFALWDQKLEENDLTPLKQLDLRIKEAWNQLDQAVKIEDDSQRQRLVYGNMCGVVDLLQLTSRFDKHGLGQELRVKLIKDFFLELAQEALSMIHSKLTAVLYAVDPSLVSMLRAGGSFELQDLPEGVSDIQSARRARALRESKAAAKAEEARQLRERMKGKSGGKPKNQTTNPKKLAQQKRKLAQQR